MDRHETGFVKYISKDELDLLIKSLKPWEHHYRCILFIMAYMGLRRGEVVRLKYKDIIGDYEKLRVTLYKQGGKIHERVIPDIVKKELDLYIFIQKPFRRGNYLFEPLEQGHSKNKHLQVSSISWMFKKLRDRTGLNDCYYIREDGSPLFRISAHTLRHYFISHFHKKSGNNLVFTQRVIGHKKLSTTAKYIFDLDEEKEIVNLIP